MDVNWTGPYAWPGFEKINGLPPLPDHGGVYLQTFEHRDGGYVLYAAGITRNPFRRRFMQHNRAYLSGDYNILDPVQARNGVRSELWHGWTVARQLAKRAEYAERRAELQEAAQRQLAEFRIFVAEVEPHDRMRDRLEAAIMNRLYADAAALPDKGMFLASRLKGEAPVCVTNACANRLLGLPEKLWI